MVAVTGSQIVKYKSLQGGHTFDIPGVTVLKNRSDPVDLTRCIRTEIVPVCALLKINAERITLTIRAVWDKKRAQQ
jgi:hypothetical protein